MRSVTSLDLLDARQLLRGGMARAEQLGVRICIAVVDGAGVMIALERMDGGKVSSVDIAMTKAYTAAAAQQSTAFYGDTENPLSPTWRIHKMDGGRFTTLRGGIPISLRDNVIGGIGVSGGTGEQDIEIAEAAIATLDLDPASTPESRNRCARPLT